MRRQQCHPHPRETRAWHHRPTSRQERPASLSRPSAPQGRTPTLCHIHQALRCAQVGQTTEAAIIEGRHFKTAEAKRRTWADLIDRYMVDILPNKGASAIRKQTQQLLWWKARLGYCIVADITPALIAEHRDILRRGKTKPRRSQCNGQPLSCCLVHVFTTAAKEWHWYDDNPVHKITKPRLPRGRVRF